MKETTKRGGGKEKILSWCTLPEGLRKVFRKVERKRRDRKGENEENPWSGTRKQGPNGGRERNIWEGV